MRHFLGQIPAGCRVTPDGALYCEWQAEGGAAASSITAAGLFSPDGAGAGLPPGFGPPLPGGAALPTGAGFGVPAIDMVPVDGGFPGFFAPEIPPDLAFQPLPGQAPETMPPGIRPVQAPYGPEGPPPEEEGAPVAGRLAAVGGFGAAILAALALTGTLAG